MLTPNPLPSRLLAHPSGPHSLRQGHDRRLAIDDAGSQLDDREPRIRRCQLRHVPFGDGCAVRVHVSPQEGPTCAASAAWVANHDALLLESTREAHTTI